ncbi:MAG: hypothetical protein ACOX5X_03865 [Acholeplasmataceae bacterium]|jgi:hypothetical protein
MKKLLILFLLAFPILIFAIINLSASIIGWVIPLPVETIEVSLDQVNWSKSIDLDVEVLNETTSEMEIYYRILPANARNKEITVYSSDEFLSDIKDDNIISPDQLAKEDKEFKDGIGKAKVSLYEYGFSEITLITADGKYEATIDVSVVNPDDDPNEVKSIIFEYKEALHQDYRFGNLNSVRLDFKYFPKGADQSLIADQITADFGGDYEMGFFEDPERKGEGYFNLTFQDFVGQQKFETTTQEGRKAKYTFNVDKGYNIKGHSVEEISQFVKSGKKVFQLEEINLKSTLKITNGTQYDGNNFKITHKDMESGTQVTVLDNNTSLNRVHIVGPLVNEGGQIIPRELITNLRMTNSLESRFQSITNSTIENGRYNIFMTGQTLPSFDENGQRIYVPSEFKIENVKFIGALMGAIRVDNHEDGAMAINSTRVEVKNLSFEWVGIAVWLDNSRGEKEMTKGYSVLVIKPHDRADLINSLDTSKNWRNLDEASGFLKEQNALGLLDELKKYDNMTFKKGRNYFVSPVIMLYGGAVNNSYVIFDSKTESDLVREERRPSTIEAMHEKIGGRAPFVVYALNKKYHPDYSSGGN